MIPGETAAPEYIARGWSKWPGGPPTSGAHLLRDSPLHWLIKPQAVASEAMLSLARPDPSHTPA